MVRPRRAKAKLIFAEAQATRMVAGKVRVMPNPTAGPLTAMMVGLQQLWMARVTRPPLLAIISNTSLASKEVKQTHLYKN